MPRITPREPIYRINSSVKRARNSILPPGFRFYRNKQNELWVTNLLTNEEVQIFPNELFNNEETFTASVEERILEVLKESGLL